jgi:hypothetical protein
MEVTHKRSFGWGKEFTSLKLIRRTPLRRIFSKRRRFSIRKALEFIEKPAFPRAKFKGT